MKTQLAIAERMRREDEARVAGVESEKAGLWVRLPAPSKPSHPPTSPTWKRGE